MDKQHLSRLWRCAVFFSALLALTLYPSERSESAQISSFDAIPTLNAPFRARVSLQGVNDDGFYVKLATPGEYQSLGFTPPSFARSVKITEGRNGPSTIYISSNESITEREFIILLKLSDNTGIVFKPFRIQIQGSGSADISPLKEIQTSTGESLQVSTISPTRTAPPKTSQSSPSTERARVVEKRQAPQPSPKLAKAAPAPANTAAVGGTSAPPASAQAFASPQTAQPAAQSAASSPAYPVPAPMPATAAPSVAAPAMPAPAMAAPAIASPAPIPAPGGPAYAPQANAAMHGAGSQSAYGVIYPPHQYVNTPGFTPQQPNGAPVQAPMDYRYEQALRQAGNPARAPQSIAQEAASGSPFPGQLGGGLYAMLGASIAVIVLVLIGLAIAGLYLSRRKSVASRDQASAHAQGSRGPRDGENTKPKRATAHVQQEFSEPYLGGFESPRSSSGYRRSADSEVAEPAPSSPPRQPAGASQARSNAIAELTAIVDVTSLTNSIQDARLHAEAVIKNARHEARKNQIIAEACEKIMASGVDAAMNQPFHTVSNLAIYADQARSAQAQELRPVEQPTWSQPQAVTERSHNNSPVRTPEPVVNQTSPAQGDQRESRFPEAPSAHHAAPPSDQPMSPPMQQATPVSGATQESQAQAQNPVPTSNQPVTAPHNNPATNIAQPASQPNPPTEEPTGWARWMAARSGPNAPSAQPSAAPPANTVNRLRVAGLNPDQRLRTPGQRRPGVPEGTDQPEGQIQGSPDAQIQDPRGAQASTDPTRIDPKDAEKLELAVVYLNMGDINTAEILLKELQRTASAPVAQRASEVLNSMSNPK